MGTQYDGPQIVGMDLHRRSVLVRMTPEGSVWERFASADLADLLRMGRLPGGVDRSA